jgi:signal peptidase II
MKFIYRVIVSLMLVVGVDMLSKFWAERFLDLHQPVPIVGQFFQLTLSYNTGVAFGLFAKGGPWPTILTGIIILGLVIWLVNLLRSGDFPTQATWPIGLFVSGAIANFVDRLSDGRVTDFLDVGFGASRWPTFNLADGFIVFGVTLLILITLFEKRSQGTEQ